jgi:hypothetical protein
MMKNILRYLWRDKVDLLIFLVVVAAAVQYFFLSYDLTPAFAVLALYCFGVMHRLGVFTDTILRQDLEIKKLNEQLQDKDKFITQLIRKYGNPKEGAEFLKKIKTKLNS